MYVNIHTHKPTGEGIELTDVAGIHPWEVGTDDRGEFSVNGRQGRVCDRESGQGRELENFPLESARTTGLDSVRAIGEIGLDYATATTPEGRELQKKLFERQLQIARERNLPVVLHCVKAFEPVIEMLSGLGLRAVIFHGFVGSTEQAQRAIRAGYYLSFGERSLSSPRTVEAMRQVPLDRMFLETDEAQVAIGEVYARAAEVLSVPVAELTQAIYANYIKIFGE